MFQRQRFPSAGVVRLLLLSITFISFAILATHRRRHPNVERSEFYRFYHSVPELLQRLKRIVPYSCPGSTLEQLGTSHNGFPIYMVRMGSTSEINPSRIMITAGMHGRERSTSLLTMFAIEEFCEMLRAGDGDSLERVEALIVPIMNPDGQEWSRLVKPSARKNRRPPEDGTAPACDNYGVDLNRNWPAFWNRGNGSSSDPCHDQYSGRAALSEAESRGVARAIGANRGLRAHADIHSFGQLIYRDWAFKARGARRGASGDVETRQLRMARAMRMAMRAERRTDMVDVGAYFATARLTGRTQGGTLQDYMMMMGVPSVTVELGPRVTRENVASGFAMNESDLVWRSRELFRGLAMVVVAGDGEKKVPEYADEDLGVVLP